MDKRYQVFVSSTYTDLIEERQVVMQTLMENDCIPAGMELFPAADEDQFEFIKRIIDDCDYYLIVLGGRYGSVAADGVSYTEKEYDYATSRGLKVIALVHSNSDQIIVGKSEKDKKGKIKLEKFRAKICKGRMVKFWNDKNQISGILSNSLSKTIKLFPAVGWVRANQVASVEILEEINQLRKEKEVLEAKIGSLLKDQKILEIMEKEIIVLGRPHQSSDQDEADVLQQPVKLSKIFFIAATLISTGLASERRIFQAMSELIFKENSLGIAPNQIRIINLSEVKSRLNIFDLIDFFKEENSNGSSEICWKMTLKGKEIATNMQYQLIN